MLRDFFANIPVVVKNLLLINILMFIATVVSEPNGNFMTANFSVFYFDSPFFKPYQLVTHMFMHGSIAHVFFNMFALASFGSLLERIWGPKRFLIFYFATGLGAILLHQLVMMYEVHHLTGAVQVYADGKLPNIERVFEIYGTPTVGASGAIYGIIIAFGMLFPNTELMLIFFPVPIKAKYLVPFMVLLELFLGVNNFQWDNIAHFAHLGGALFGFILIKIWQRNRKNFY